MRKGKITLKRVGGYDPKKGPKHPDNFDPTLERAKKRQKIPKLTSEEIWATSESLVSVTRRLVKREEHIKDWDKLVADCLFELQLCVTALGDAGAKNRYYKLERRLQVLRGQLEMFP